MSRLSIGTAAVAAAALVATVLAPPSIAAAADTYGDSMSVAFGANEHSSIPVDLTLPAPGDSRRVAEVTFRWQQRTPTYQGSSTGSFVVETPQCVADAECQVHAEVPTGRMMNSVMSSVSIIVSDAAPRRSGRRAGRSTSRTPSRRSRSRRRGTTTPSGTSTVTLSADATPSSSGAPIKRVRFYVNPTGKEDFPYREDATAPYTVTVPSSEIAESTKGGTLYAVAEDVEGNLSQYGYEDVPAVHPHGAGGTAADRVVAFPSRGRPAGGWHVDGGVPALGHRTARVGAAERDRPGDAVHRPDRDLPGRRAPQRQAVHGPPTWGSDFGGRKKVRTAESYLHWTASSGMTPGEHTVTLRVTSSYGSVGTATRRFVITDGVKLGRVMSGTARRQGRAHRHRGHVGAAPLQRRGQGPWLRSDLLRRPPGRGVADRRLRGLPARDVVGLPRTGHRQGELVGAFEARDLHADLRRAGELRRGGHLDDAHVQGPACGRHQRRGLLERGHGRETGDRAGPGRSDRHRAGRSGYPGHPAVAEGGHHPLDRGGGADERSRTAGCGRFRYVDPRASTAGCHQVSWASWGRREARR